MVTWVENVDSDGGINLVFNPSFEILSGDQPAGWNIPEDLCSVDETTRRTGRRSLRFENRDPTVYKLITQNLNPTPGKRYAVVAWVKTQDVKGGKGVGVCVEWKDEKGKWLGGIYPRCILGTNDWKPVGTIFTLPEEVGERKVASVYLVLYMSRGTTGIAWFDDVQLREMVEPTLLC